MNLVDVYIAETGRHLPEKNRADLQREIRSLIEDALDDAAESQGRPRDEDLVVEVLQKFGPPEKVAASYSPTRYLIGPAWYPTYLTVLKIVVAIVLVVSSIGLGLGIGQSVDAGQTVLEAILAALGGVLGAVVTAFGNVTLVFAILERFQPAQDWVNKDEAWDPRAMKAEPDTERVSPAEPVVEIALITALLLALNVYPQWLGVSAWVNGEWVHAPALGAEFFRYLPFLNLLLIAGVVHSGMLLQKGRWTAGLRWFDIATSLASILLFGVMAAGPHLIRFDPADLARLGWDPTTIQTFLQATGQAVLYRSILGIAIAANVLDLVKHLYYLYIRRGGFELSPQE